MLHGKTSISNSTLVHHRVWGEEVLMATDGEAPAWVLETCPSGVLRWRPGGCRLVAVRSAAVWLQTLIVVASFLGDNKSGKFGDQSSEILNHG